MFGQDESVTLGIGVAISAVIGFVLLLLLGLICGLLGLVTSDTLDQVGLINQIVTVMKVL